MKKLLLLLALWGFSAQAQPVGGKGPAHKVFAIQGQVDTSKYAGLSRLPGYPFAVRYSPGCEAARSVARKTKKAYEFLAKKTNTRPAIGLLVITEEQWAQHSYIPIPGMPHNRTGNLVMQAGTTLAANQAMTAPPFGAIMARPENARLLKPYRTASGDLDFTLRMRQIAIHELGHAFHRDQAVGQALGWLGELFATVCMMAFIEEQDRASRTVAYNVGYVINQVDATQLRYRTLTQMEQNNVIRNHTNYAWFQNQLGNFAAHLVAEGGPDVVGKFYAFMLKHQSAGEFPTDAELAVALGREIHPVAATVITKWPYQ